MTARTAKRLCITGSIIGYMKITKYEHSCVVIEEKGEKLVIDPGELTALPTLTYVRAIIFTHVRRRPF